METTKAPLSNTEFADRVGCSISMASRLRTGSRLPSADLLTRIWKAFGIPAKDLFNARAAGPQQFSCLLRERAFGDPD